MSWLKVLFTVDKHQISLCWILKPLLNWIVIVDSINIDDNLLIFTHVFLYIRLINHFKNLVLMLSFKNFKIKKKTILFVHVGRSTCTLDFDIIYVHSADYFLAFLILFLKQRYFAVHLQIQKFYMFRKKGPSIVIN